MNGCIGDPTVTQHETQPDSTTGVRVELYESCSDELTVVLYVIEGGVHEWPTGAFSAGDIVTEFLLAHQP